MHFPLLLWRIHAQDAELLHCSQMEKDALGGMSMAKPSAVIHSDIIEIHLLNCSY